MGVNGNQPTSRQIRLLARFDYSNGFHRVTRPVVKNDPETDRGTRVQGCLPGLGGDSDAQWNARKVWRTLVEGQQIPALRVISIWVAMFLDFAEICKLPTSW